MKHFLLACLSTFIISSFALQAQGLRNGTQFSTIAIPGSTMSWSTPGNAASSDNNYATIGNLPNTIGAYTDYLVVSNFGFNVPAGNLIAGITVEIEQADPNASTADYSIRIVKEGVIGTAERSAGAAYSTADTYRTYGGANDTWGMSWSFKDVSDAGFGIAIAAQRNSTGTTTAGRIDHVRIIVHIQPFMATLPVNLTSFTATRTTSNVHVKWTTSEESAIDQYEVERSTNGRDFMSIGTVVSNNNNGTTQYGFTDNNPVKGSSWYRLKIVEQTGLVKNSSVVLIRSEESNKNTLYPTVINSGQSLYITNPGTEQLQVRFYNAGGQLVANASTSGGQINPSFRSGGTVYYQILDKKGMLTGTGKVVVQ